MAAGGPGPWHAIVGDRLPGRGRGRDGHGVHGRPDRSRGRPRHARRPSPRRRRALAGRVSLRPAPPGVGVLRRGVDRARSRRRAGAAARRRGSRNGPASRRSRPTTTTSCIAASSARAVSPSSGQRVPRATAPPISSPPGCRARPWRSTCDAGSSTPPTSRRPSRRRPLRRSVLPTTSRVVAVNDLARLDAARPRT